MIDINVGNKANIGNNMFQYMYCRGLQNAIGASRLHGYNIPEFGLMSNKVDLPGRVLSLPNGHRHSMQEIAYKLTNGIYDSLQFDAYVQRLEYYPMRDICNSYFRSQIDVDKTYLGQNHLTINIRAGEILEAIHPDYHPVPISFYEHIANHSKLSPVLMGQLQDDYYSDEVRRRFAGCPILPSRSAIEDFEIVRNSTNIAMSVSSFSWLAAWLSNISQNIHLPMLGFLNPVQRPDIDLLPTNDQRYRFYAFQEAAWEAKEWQKRTLLASAANFRPVSPSQARAMIL